MKETKRQKRGEGRGTKGDPKKVDGGGGRERKERKGEWIREGERGGGGVGEKE